MELELLRLLVQARLSKWLQSLTPEERIRLITAVPSDIRPVRVFVPLRDEEGQDFPTSAVVEAIAGLVMHRATYQIDKLRAVRRFDENGRETWFAVVHCRAAIPDRRLRAALRAATHQTATTWALQTV